MMHPWLGSVYNKSSQDSLINGVPKGGGMKSSTTADGSYEWGNGGAAGFRCPRPHGRYSLTDQQMMLQAAAQQNENDDEPLPAGREMRVQSAVLRVSKHAVYVLGEATITPGRLADVTERADTGLLRRSQHPDHDLAAT